MQLGGKGSMLEERKDIRYALSQAIDLNSASYDELRRLRGIGANYAMRIIELRPFYSIDAVATKARIPTYVLERITDQFIFNEVAPSQTGT